MNTYKLVLTCLLYGLLIPTTAAIPELQREGQPFPMLGGELGNSSASSLECMEDAWPKFKHRQ